jgi:citrate synthase
MYDRVNVDWSINMTSDPRPWIGAVDAARLLEHSNIDFALAAVGRVLNLPAGSPLILFAIGRSVGWIGHAMEQYATGQLIRPRAKYVGVPPAQAD